MSLRENGRRYKRTKCQDIQDVIHIVSMVGIFVQVFTVDRKPSYAGPVPLIGGSPLGSVETSDNALNQSGANILIH